VAAAIWFFPLFFAQGRRETNNDKKNATILITPLFPAPTKKHHTTKTTKPTTGAYTTAALWEGQMKPLSALRLLALSWAANFAGCALFVGLALAAGLFDPLSASGPSRHLYARALAHKKAALLPWGVCFARGVLANMLVAFATWAANAAQDLAGKAVGIWLCISAFAMFGERLASGQTPGGGWGVLGGCGAFAMLW
jgi:hypothetical protein